MSQGTRSRKRRDTRSYNVLTPIKEGNESTHNDVLEYDLNNPDIQPVEANSSDGGLSNSGHGQINKELPREAEASLLESRGEAQAMPLPEDEPSERATRVATRSSKRLKLIRRQNDDLLAKTSAESSLNEGGGIDLKTSSRKANSTKEETTLKEAYDIETENKTLETCGIEPITKMQQEEDVETLIPNLGNAVMPRILSSKNESETDLGKDAENNDMQSPAKRLCGIYSRSNTREEKKILGRLGEEERTQSIFHDGFSKIEALLQERKIINAQEAVAARINSVVDSDMDEDKLIYEDFLDQEEGVDDVHDDNLSEEEFIDNEDENESIPLKIVKEPETKEKEGIAQNKGKGSEIEEIPRKETEIEEITLSSDDDDEEQFSSKVLNASKIPGVTFMMCVKKHGKFVFLDCLVCSAHLTESSIMKHIQSREHILNVLKYLRFEFYLKYHGTVTAMSRKFLKPLVLALESKLPRQKMQQVDFDTHQNTKRKKLDVILKSFYLGFKLCDKTLIKRSYLPQLLQILKRNLTEESGFVENTAATLLNTINIAAISSLPLNQVKIKHHDRVVFVGNSSLLKTISSFVEDELTNFQCIVVDFLADWSDIERRLDVLDQREHILFFIVGDVSLVGNKFEHSSCSKEKCLSTVPYYSCKDFSLDNAKHMSTLADIIRMRNDHWKILFLPLYPIYLIDHKTVSERVSHNAIHTLSSFAYLVEYDDWNSASQALERVWHEHIVNSFLKCGETADKFKSFFDPSNTDFLFGWKVPNIIYLKEISFNQKKWKAAFINFINEMTFTNTVRYFKNHSKNLPAGSIQEGDETPEIKDLDSDSDGPRREWRDSVSDAKPRASSSSFKQSQNVDNFWTVNAIGSSDNVSSIASSSARKPSTIQVLGETCRKYISSEPSGGKPDGLHQTLSQVNIKAFDDIPSRVGDKLKPPFDQIYVIGNKNKLLFSGFLPHNVTKVDYNINEADLTHVSAIKSKLGPISQTAACLLAFDLSFIFKKLTNVANGPNCTKVGCSMRIKVCQLKTEAILDARVISKFIDACLAKVTALVNRLSETIPTFILPIFPNVIFFCKEKQLVSHDILHLFPSHGALHVYGNERELKIYIMALQEAWSLLLKVNHKKYASTLVAEEYASQSRHIFTRGENLPYSHVEWVERKIWSSAVAAIIKLMVKSKGMQENSEFSQDSSQAASTSDLLKPYETTAVEQETSNQASKNFNITTCINTVTMPVPPPSHIPSIAPNVPLHTSSSMSMGYNRQYMSPKLAEIMSCSASNDYQHPPNSFQVNPHQTYPNPTLVNFPPYVHGNVAPPAFPVHVHPPTVAGFVPPPPFSNHVPLSFPSHVPPPAVASSVPPPFSNHVPPAFPVHVPTLAVTGSVPPPPFRNHVPPTFPAHVPPTFPAHVPPAFTSHAPPTFPAHVPPPVTDNVLPLTFSSNAPAFPVHVTPTAIGYVPPLAVTDNVPPPALTSHAPPAFPVHATPSTFTSNAPALPVHVPTMASGHVPPHYTTTPFSKHSPPQPHIYEGTSSLSGDHDAIIVEISNMSNILPTAMFEDLATGFEPLCTINEDVQMKIRKINIRFKSTFNAAITVKKLDNIRIADSILRVSVISDLAEVVHLSMEEEASSELKISQVFDKYQKRIARNINDKLNEGLDIATYKVFQCAGCINAPRCMRYHTNDDRRRNPIAFPYSERYCPKLINGQFCQSGFSCPYSHTSLEWNYNPLAFQTLQCPNESAQSCSDKPFCRFAHKDTPELLFTCSWTDVVKFGFWNSFMYLAGAIRGRCKDRKISEHKILFMSSNADIPKIAFTAIDMMAKDYKLETVLLDQHTQESSLYKSDLIVGTLDVALKFIHLLMVQEFCAIIVDDAATILKNSSQCHHLARLFNKRRLTQGNFPNKVFVVSEAERTSIFNKIFRALKINYIDDKGATLGMHTSRNLPPRDKSVVISSSSRSRSPKRSRLQSFRHKSRSLSYRHRSRSKSLRYKSRSKSLKYRSRSFRHRSSPNSMGHRSRSSSPYLYKKVTSNPRSRSPSPKHKYQSSQQRRLRTPPKHYAKSRITPKRKLHSRSRSRSLSRGSIRNLTTSRSSRVKSRSGSRQRPQGSADGQLALVATTSRQRQHRRKSVLKSSPPPRKHEASTSSGYGSQNAKPTIEVSLRNYDTKQDKALVSSRVMHDEMEELQRDIYEDYKVFQDYPEIHPDYEMQYELFIKNYLRCYPGINDVHHKEKHWGEHWKAALEALKKRAYKQKLEQMLHQPGGSSVDSSSTSQEVTHPKGTEQKEFSVSGTLDLLEQLKDELGMIGTTLMPLIKECRTRGTDTPAALRLFSDPQNDIIFKMVQDLLHKKVETSSFIMRPLFETALRWTERLVKYTKDSLNQKSVGLDIISIAKGTLGKTLEFTLDFIKTALSYEGVNKPSDQQINDIFLQVCSLHFKMST